MPSARHEAERILLRDEPEVLLTLLRQSASLPLPEYEEIAVHDTDLTQLIHPELRADVALTLSKGGKVVMGLLVEVQRRVDEEKCFRWPLYAAALHDQLRVQTCLVVVALEEGVARWARRPIRTLQFGSSFSPLVLGPSNVPEVRDPEQAKRSPGLAILSAMTHGDRAGGVPIILAALQGLAVYEASQQERYASLIFSALSGATLDALEALVSTDAVMDHFSRRFFERGATQGKAEGKAEGEASALLMLLRARHLAPSPEQEAQILACRDIAQLERWITRAATASSLDVVFADS